MLQNNKISWFISRTAEHDFACSHSQVWRRLFSTSLIAPCSGIPKRPASVDRAACPHQWVAPGKGEPRSLGLPSCLRCSIKPAGLLPTPLLGSTHPPPRASCQKLQEPACHQAEIWGQQVTRQASPHCAWMFDPYLSWGIFFSHPTTWITVSNLLIWGNKISVVVQTGFVMLNECCLLGV